MAEKTEKKLTGLQMPLNISPELAKIIGTKKGEQVALGLDGIITRDSLIGVQAASDQEAVGLPQGEEPAGTEDIEHFLFTNIRVMKLKECIS